LQKKLRASLKYLILQIGYNKRFLEQVLPSLFRYYPEYLCL
jgi:hypothetical protein